MRAFFIPIFLLISACQQTIADAPKPQLKPDSEVIEQAKQAAATYDGKKMLEILEQVQDKNTKTYLNLKGLALDFSGDNVAARENYRNAHELAPEDIEILNNLALSHIISGNYDDAVKILEGLINTGKAGKYLAKIRQNLAMAYGLQGKGKEAYKNLIKDLPPEKAKENLKYYNKLRSKK